MLAGIIQSPARQSPFVNRQAATRRRNYVLQQMADNGYITAAQAEAAEAKPIVTRGQPQPLKSVAPFFAEEVRQYLEQKYGAKRLYEAGLSVQTGVDYTLQVAANRAIDHGLRLIDKRRGWRQDKPNVAALGQSAATYKNDRWNHPMGIDDVVPAVVTALTPASAHLRIGDQAVDLRSDGFGWTHKAPPALFKVGDLIDVKVVKADQSRQAGVGGARADAHSAGRAAGHRQPHRAGSRHGGRLQLREEQIQSCHAGARGRWAPPSSRSCIRRPSTAATRLRPF